MKKIAIIGSGISGLTCAYLLNSKYDIAVYESSDKIGGHTATIDVDHEGRKYAVDTGFIIYNNDTYPRLAKLFAHLNVSSLPIIMNFSVAHLGSGLEYSSNGALGFFSQHKRLFSLKHWKLLWSILSFNKKIIKMHGQGSIPENMTTREFVEREGYPEELLEQFIVPVSAAIWSAESEGIENMPVLFYANFFMNHHLLKAGDTLQWYTVKGGAKTYLAPLTDSFKDRIHLNKPAVRVNRSTNGVSITFKDGEVKEFDQVIVATHSNQAMQLLDNPTALEEEILGKIQYQPTEVVVHSDSNLMPKVKKAWESWNCRVDESGTQTITYYSNSLHALEAPIDIFVTINPEGSVNEKKMHHLYKTEHPVFNLDTIAGQGRWAEINGQNRTWFAGAYWGNGFHEDGINSAVRVAEALGADVSFFDIH